MNPIKLFSIYCCISLLLQSCSSGPSEPEVHTVEIKGMQFVPANIVVKPGDTIVWVNKDIMVHDVTEETSNDWSSAPIPAGGSWKMVITEEADYFCSIHVVMKGKIELE